MFYNVIKYDVDSFRPDRKYDTGDVAHPEIVFSSRDRGDAERYVECCTTESAAGEQIEADLVNGGHYEGPRYIYRIAIG